MERPQRLYYLVSCSWRLLRGSDMSPQPRIIPKTIETLADAAYPSFAMLAGMELDPIERWAARFG
jgi:hypothetical protein